MIQPADNERRSSQRLPVNPRRHKVAPEQRKRVATACNNCNIRRVKCSGDNPCKQCASSSRECVYPPSTEKTTISRAHLEDLQRRVEAYERLLEDAVPDATKRAELLQQFAPSPGSVTTSLGPLTGSSQFTTGPSSPAMTSSSSASATIGQQRQWMGTQSLASSTGDFIKMEQLEPVNLPRLEGRLLRDESGVSRFMGETSEAAFLDHVKEFINTFIPLSGAEDVPIVAPSLPSRQDNALFSTLGTYSSLDSHPLPDLNVQPLWLPNPSNITAMLSSLRSLIQDGAEGAFPSGGIFYFGDLSQLPIRAPPTNPEEPDLQEYRHLAFFHAAFALTCQSNITKRPTTASEKFVSQAFFARATSILENPLDVAQLKVEDVATLAMMGMYLLEMHRVDTAALYITTAVKACEMFGLHVQSSDSGSVEGEQRRRVFWTVYVLDRMVSCMLGRSFAFADDAISTLLPMDILSLPSSAGLNAHISLSRISGQLQTTACSQSVIAGNLPAPESNILWKLEHWLSSLPPSLHLINNTSHDPAVCNLHIHHNHLIVLATRSLFLSAVKQTISERSVRSPLTPTTIMQPINIAAVEACTSAASRTIDLTRHLLSITRRKLLHAGLHHLFVATLVIILQGLSIEDDADADAETQASMTEDVDFSIDLFSRDANTGNKYAADCLDALQRLRVLVDGVGASAAGREVGVGAGRFVAGGVAMGLPGASSLGGLGISRVLHCETNGQGGGYDELMSAWVDNDWPMLDGYFDE